MKTIFLVFIAGLFLNNLRAQVVNIDDFYKPGTTWSDALDYRQAPPGHTDYVKGITYEIGHDTVLGAKTWHLVNHVDGELEEQGLYGGIRVDSQKVYFINLSGNTIFVRRHNPNTNETSLAPGAEHILYDYNLQVGDTIKWKPDFNVVYKIDSITVDGVSLRKFTFLTDTSVHSSLFVEFWIEAIGGNSGFLGSYGLNYPSYYSYTYMWTIKYCSPDHHYDFPFSSLSVYGSLFDGNCHMVPLVVNSPSATNTSVIIFPNPSSANDIHLRIQNGSFKKVCIYDVWGKEVYQQQFIANSSSAILQTALPPGAYLIKAWLTNGEVVLRTYSKQ